MRTPLLKDANTPLPQQAPSCDVDGTTFLLFTAKSKTFSGHPSNMPALLKKRNHHLKRLVDLLISSVLMLTLFPWLVPLLAILIKLDSKGPVFFVQPRNKRATGVFRCIKFRTMFVNNAADLLPAAQNDARITRIGCLLRRHHLDELPQLLNVWLGDMSLVGPRPHMLSDNQRFEELVPHYHQRHRVKPGITGLAQVSGYTGPVTSVESIWARVEADVYYVHNWSLAMDAKIAGRTLLKMASGKQSTHSQRYL